MKNIIVFGASDDFEKYHRRPMLKSLSELMNEQNISIHYCNPPKFLLNFLQKKIEIDTVGKLTSFLYSLFYQLALVVYWRHYPIYLFIYLWQYSYVFVGY